MKTLITTLPIYDKIAKQCYERSKHEAGMHPVICPIERLPSFMWLDDGDGATSITEVILYDESGVVSDITGDLTIATHAVTGDVYFYYEGDDLSSALNPGIYYLKLTTDNAKVYYSEWFKADCVYDETDYSTKYLIINFSNTCDLGEILYHEGFTQTIWFQSDTMESSFPIEESGQNNGNGRFVRTFARQVKKYLTKTLAMPDYMVDVFHRLKLHDTVELIDLVGDTHDVYNLEVEHEWLFDDKYYAKLDLTFDYDEVVVISACCNNIT